MQEAPAEVRRGGLYDRGSLIPAFAPGKRERDRGYSRSKIISLMARKSIGCLAVIRENCRHAEIKEEAENRKKKREKDYKKQN